MDEQIKEKEYIILVEDLVIKKSELTNMCQELLAIATQHKDKLVPDVVQVMIDAVITYSKEYKEVK